ncbi:MAG TPA: tetratricopeptide repeat protein, partial [Anaerolineales bacterium]|nr:tetratricopeptide repeat protein [Anaerolineales bacterium]
QGNVREGTTLLEESLAIYRTLGDKIGQADTLKFLTVVNKGHPEYLADLIKEAIRLYRELGDLSGITLCLMELARLTMWKGDFSSPAPMLEEAITISRQLGSQSSEVEALITHGTLAYWRGDYEGAMAFYEEAIGISEKTGDRFQNLWGRVHKAYVVLRQGYIQKACALFKDNITNQAGLTITLVYNIEGLASLYVHEHQFARAVRLFAWTNAMREKLGDPRPPVEQASVERDLAFIRSKVDEGEFENFSAKGRTMTVEQAIDFALQG